MTSIAAWLQFVVTFIAVLGVAYMLFRQLQQNVSINTIQGDNRHIREQLTTMEHDNGHIREQLTTIVHQTNSQMSELQEKLNRTEAALNRALVGKALAESDTEGANARSDRLSQSQSGAPEHHEGQQV